MDIPVKKLGSSASHLITLPIDLEDGGDIVEVTMPLINWMPRPKVEAYDAWFEESRKKIDAITEWENSRAQWDADHAKWEKSGRPGGKFRKAPPVKAPYDAEKELLPYAAHHFTLRWLHDYCTEDEFRRIWVGCSPGLAAEIFTALQGGGEDITVGESDASADS